MTTKHYSYNMETLQELYAFQFYRVYKVFPKSKDLESNRDYLLAKIKYLTTITQGHDHEILR